MKNNPAPPNTNRPTGIPGSFRVGRLAGIDFRIHFLFPLILLWVGWGAYSRKQDATEAWQAVGFVLLLFCVVVLHELGHAMAARRYGIATKDITLLPIGGVARLERMPEKPAQELVIAIAGPLVNVALAIPLAVIVWLTNNPLDLSQAVEGNWSIWQRLLAANIILAVFNMIPAFPMDGGRVLRAILAMRLPYVEATNVAASIGQAFAVLMGMAGLFVNPFLVLIAVFVWIGAASEATGVRVKKALDGVFVRDVMVTKFRALNSSDSIQKAVDALMEGFQEDFPVLEPPGVAGMLSRADMVRALASDGANRPIADFYTRQNLTASPDERLAEVLPRMEACEGRVMPVMQDGRLVGLITPDNLTDFLMLHTVKSSKRDAPIGR